MKQEKLVILAGRGESTNMVYHALKDEFLITKVIIEQPVDQKSFLKRRVKNLGIAKVFGQILFKIIIEPQLRKSAKDRISSIKQEAGLIDSPIDEHLVVHVDSVNSAPTIELLQELEPKVVVVNGTRIISKKVLTAINAVFLNTHAGITPLYRGVHGGYWALVNKDQDNCGVTVHLVDSGVDTGNIIYQALIKPTAEDNFVTYPLLQLRAGLPLLKKAILDALEKNLVFIHPPIGESKLWSHPTILEYLSSKVK